MGLSWQEYWSRLPLPPPGDLPNQASKLSPRPLALAGGLFTSGKIYSPILLGKCITDRLLFTRCCSGQALPSLLHPGRDRTGPCESSLRWVAPRCCCSLHAYLPCVCGERSVSLLPHLKAQREGAMASESVLPLQVRGRNREGEQSPHTRVGPKDFVFDLCHNPGIFVLILKMRTGTQGSLGVVPS